VLAAWLLDREPDADAERVTEVLSSSLCRCTGYGPILAATLAVQGSGSA
jgi:carbon-monoxide dehydrogenase small subunit